MVQIGIVMGSNSDWEVMQHAARQLKDLGIGYETRVVSAHRTPDLLFEYAESASSRGLYCIIAGAGGAAHLPGMLAAKTTLPVLCWFPSSGLGTQVFEAPASFSMASRSLQDMGSQAGSLIVIHESLREPKEPRRGSSQKPNGWAKRHPRKANRIKYRPRRGRSLSCAA